ncbi:anti-sigma factor antagonist [Streptomyces albofaciens JCM 4342]|uniref:STAS domain-containing protein n=1 Tax=Streptomyces albofaciens TaxID=66866 RepID=UPI00123A4E96|nr:STAS domain-containing protein [Streptomyces albofaciens]KAA6223920.1 anti-sigma factor antagonist [Streptomyces albofaciens JCM 4342]
MDTRCPEQKEGCRIVRPVGELDLATSAALRDELRGNDAAPSARVIADLRRVTFIDSSGLEELRTAQARCEAVGGWLRLVYDHRSIDLLLQLTGLEQQFPRYADVDDARNGRPSLPCPPAPR